MLWPMCTKGRAFCSPWDFTARRRSRIGISASRPPNSGKSGSANVRRLAGCGRVQATAAGRAKPIAIEAGDILNTCWGYEQTNREFFQVIEVKGHFAILREIAQVSEETSFLAGHCVPQADTFIGEPIRRRINGDSVKIDGCRRAHKWNTAKVAGVAIGPKVNWSAYA